MIIDGRGALVWFRQLPSPDYATDLQEAESESRGLRRHFSFRAHYSS
jgi:hypothetical protein